MKVVTKVLTIYFQSRDIFDFVKLLVSMNMQNLVVAQLISDNPLSYITVWRTHFSAAVGLFLVS